MPYVGEGRNDIFVSYAHADNDPGFSGNRWVSQFAAHVGTYLKQRLGSADDLRIYFDNRDLQANHDLDEIISEVEGAAVFIAILSPSYVQRDWTQKELSAFSRLPDARNRIFSVELLPVDSPLVYPPQIETRNRAKFWHQPDLDSNTAMTIDPTLHPQIYGQRLMDLVDQIKGLLVERRSATKSALLLSPSADQAITREVKGTVLLAQSTDELESEREQVKSYLRQMNFEVLPSTDYPQGGEAFADVFSADLARADVFVQLLGKAAGRKPPDLPEGYIHYQFNTAEKSGKPMMLWAHPDIDVSALSDPGQIEMFSSAALVVSGLESFKSEVSDRFAKTRATQKQMHGEMVYIGAEKADLDIAKQLQNELHSRQFPVALPTFEGSAEEIRQDLEENLMDSSTLVFIHGSAPVNWVRGNLRRLHKLLALRQEPPQTVAYLKAPPPKDSDIGVVLPYLHTIDCSDVINIDELIDLIENGA